MSDQALLHQVDIYLNYLATKAPKKNRYFEGRVVPLKHDNPEVIQYLLNRGIIKIVTKGDTPQYRFTDIGISVLRKGGITSDIEKENKQDELLQLQTEGLKTQIEFQKKQLDTIDIKIKNLEDRTLYSKWSFIMSAIAIIVTLILALLQISK